MEILHLPDISPSVYELKLQVVNLLMYMPKEYSTFLYANRVIDVLLWILDEQLHLVLEESVL